MNRLFSEIIAPNFWTLNWYYLVAVAISGSGLIIAYKNFTKKSVKPIKDIERLIGSETNNSNATNTNNIPINITNNYTKPYQENESVGSDVSQSENRMKSTIKILFVDDNHTDYKMVSILKRAGWINTRAIKDITDLDNNIVTESDIIFVDINGVGLTMFEDQGLGLATALKNKYPKKKIVIYSAETLGDRFHKALRQVDDCLPKNAEPYQFIDLVENLSKGMQ
ncbi:CheY-like chemotaxis protein [Pedobacter sp. UYP24]